MEGADRARESSIVYRHYTFRLLDVRNPTVWDSESRWMELCEDVFAILYVVDIAVYDERIGSRSQTQVSSDFGCSVGELRVGDANADVLGWVGNG